MASHRSWEIAAFFTIATALHVSAGAYLFTSQDSSIGDPALPAGQISSGSAEIEELVGQWETSPETASVDQLEQPEEIEQPELEEPVADVVNDVPVPTQMTPPAEPDVMSTEANLPEMKQFLPEFQEMPTPEIIYESALALDVSERPLSRPEKKKEQPKRETSKQAQPASPKAPKAEVAQQGGGNRGNSAKPTTGAGGGGGGTGQSAAAIARGESAWKGEVLRCVGRKLRVPPNPGGLTVGSVSVTFQVSTSGSVRQAGLSSSSGNSRFDRGLIRAAQRIKCPAAPAGVTSVFLFEQPINIQ